MKNSTSPLLILISAPSGGGKTTLCNQLLASRPGMVRAITCTTRAPRPGEKDGVDYYFFSAAEFQRRVKADEFIEHATVFGCAYGILRSELLDKLHSGRDVLLNVDVQGAETIRGRVQKVPELKSALVTVFLTPPSWSVLAERLRKRNSDAPEEVQKRLGVAKHEVSFWRHFDYLLISTSVAEDLRRMLAIVEAEKMRALRSKAPEF
jgi:guanylate kinase